MPQFPKHSLAMAEQLDIDFLLERDRHAEALLDLSRRIERAANEQEAFDAAFDVLRGQTSYRHYWIFSFDPDLQHAHYYMGSGGPESNPSTATLTIPGDAMLEEIAASHDIVMVEDARTDLRTNKEIVARIGNRTIVNVPIIIDKRTLGAVGTGTFGDEGIRPPSPAERDFLKSVASHLAISLDRIRNRAEWQRSEKALRHMNRTLLTLSSGNEALVRAGSEAELLDRMCRILVEVGGHRIVWIQLNRKPGDKELYPAAVSSTDATIPLAAERAPVGNALADALAGGKPELISDIYFDALSTACRADLLKAGCRAGLVLPLVASSGLLGALSIFAENMDSFDKAELSLLKELADDLAYGIQSQRTHAEQQQSVARLQKTTEATIVALANTLELRDPYTAGHQRRVALLAKAIALRIGIDAERAEAIYLAGMIHDIGKIYVPSEVLTRPGKLTPLEYSLVQTHVEAGYSILHPIDFPWPLADIVHQHHERLDGSGYPRGIRDGDIMLDARILAVADVVEAMSAHRPYRPGLGIDAALAEIESGKDRLYDATVVDGCIALFREYSFKFE